MSITVLAAINNYWKAVRCKQRGVLKESTKAVALLQWNLSGIPGSAIRSYPLFRPLWLKGIGFFRTNYYLSFLGGATPAYISDQLLSQLPSLKCLSIANEYLRYCEYHWTLSKRYKSRHQRCETYQKRKGGDVPRSLHKNCTWRTLTIYERFRYTLSE